MLLLASVALMGWFTLGVSMLICSASEAWSVVERLVHPTTYLLIPASGMLFLLEWLPPSARDVLKWLPLTQILDLARMGEFNSVDGQYVDGLYLVAVCALLTLTGLASLRLIRRRVHVE